MRNIIQVSCRYCGEKISLVEAGDHLRECEHSRHVHKAIEKEFAGTERMLTRVAAECHFGYSEAG